MKKVDGAPVVILVAALLACGGAPQSYYRNGGASPAARPVSWDGRTAPAGSLRAEGTLSASSVNQEDEADFGDTALNVPATTIDGVVTLAPIEHLEVGVRGSYSDRAWMGESSDGTMPLPDNGSVWAVGPEVRATIPLSEDGTWALGLAANHLQYRLPVTQWGLKGNCMDRFSCSDDDYELIDSGTERRFVFNGSAYLSGRLRWKVESYLFGGMSVHEGFKNIGFTNRQYAESTLEKDGVVPIVSGGASFVFGQARLSGQLYVPVSWINEIEYGPGLMLTFGGAFALWSNESPASASNARR